MQAEADDMSKCCLKEVYKQQFPLIFQNILLWKQTPGHNSWVLEKVMEVFCRDVAQDTELMEAVGFPAFLNGFLEDERLIQYPDCVMNNVALMAAEVLLSRQSGSNHLASQAFRIIRSPLEYWLVNKGQRVDVTLQIFNKFVKRQVVLHLLDEVKFDLAQALLHCLSSPHNYTRKSAGDYIVHVVTFLYDKSLVKTDEKVLEDVKTRTMQTLNELLHQFNTEFTNYANTIMISSDGLDHNSSTSAYNRNTLVNYCHLLSDIAVASDEWCQNCSDTGMFDAVAEFLQVLALDDETDHCNLYRCSIVMMNRLIEFSKTERKQKIDKLQNLLVHLVHQRKDYDSLCEVVHIAGLLLLKWKGLLENPVLVFELSLLPVFNLCRVAPLYVLTTCPSVYTSVENLLKAEQKSKPSRLIKESVNTLFLIKDETIGDFHYPGFLHYVMLRKLTPPSRVLQPFLNGPKLRNDMCLTFLILLFPRITEILKGNANETYYANCIQNYIKACLDYPGIQHRQLSPILEAYVEVMKNHISRVSGVNESAECTYNKEIFNNVMEKLQHKMVDIDPHVRELSVKFAGDLFMIGNMNINATSEMLNVMSSLWRCVEDKSEVVALKVLEFLLEAASKEKLADLLGFLQITQKDVESQIHHYLLSSQWDNIKPVAFNLLTKICADDNDLQLVKYADACLHQDNSLLALAVVDYIHHLFSAALALDSDVGKVERVTHLYTQGWGDLLLFKSSAIDTCCLRKTSSLLKSLLVFMEHPDAAAVIQQKVVSFSSSVNRNLHGHSDPLHAQFSQVCQEILRRHGLVVNRSTTACRGDVNPEYVKMMLKRKATNLNLIESEPVTKRQRCQGNLEAVDNCQGVGSTKSGTSCLICSLIDEDTMSNCQAARDQKEYLHHVQAGMVTYLSPNDDDNVNVDASYLDSTKELPPLSLSTQPFPSQNLIKACLPSQLPNTLANKLTDLLCWLAFIEMLKKINPERLEQEAQRSTDEYERNSFMLLHDIDQMLKRNLSSLSDQLENELVAYFLSKFSGLLNHMANTVGKQSQLQLLKEIVTVLLQLLQVSKEEKSFLRYVLQQRRYVLLEPRPQNEIKLSLDYFLKRLEILRQQGYGDLEVREYFTTSDSLGVLLDLYRSNAKLKNTASAAVHGSSISCSHPEIVNETHSISTGDNNEDEHLAKIDILATTVQNMCANITKSNILGIFQNLEASEVHCVHDLFSDGTVQHENLKALLTLQKKDIFKDIIKFLISLTKELILLTLECNDQARKERYNRVISEFDQLKNWHKSEDADYNSDGDNDPTALDCF